MIWKDEDKFDSVINLELGKLGVDLPKIRPLVKAIIAKESSFKPDAYRAEPKIKDASRGLMQILLGSAKMEGFKGQESELFRPEINIHFATKHLLRKLNKYPQLNDAISAYNGGKPLKRPDGSYINSDYVEKTRLYLGYFLAKESGDPEQVARAEAVIKKK